MRRPARTNCGLFNDGCSNRQHGVTSLQRPRQSPDPWVRPLICIQVHRWTKGRHLSAARCPPAQARACWRLPFGGMRAVAHVAGLPCEAWISVATAPRGQTDNAPQSGLTVLARNRLCPKQKRAKMCQQGAKDRAGSGQIAVVSCIFGRLIVSGFAKADAGHLPKIPLKCAGAPPFGLARRPPYPQEWRRLPGLFPDGERGLTIFPCPDLQKANRKYGENPAQSVPEMAPIWRDQPNF